MSVRHIEMREEGAYRFNAHGITHVSVMSFVVKGEGVHSPCNAHRIQVWDNTRRTIGEGSYRGPDGQTTSEAESVTLSAEPTVISAHGDVPDDRSIRPLTIGERVRLVYPGGAKAPATFVVTARPYRDPVLVPEVAAAGEDANASVTVTLAAREPKGRGRRA